MVTAKRITVTVNGVQKEVSRQRVHQLLFPEHARARMVIYEAVRSGTIKPATKYHCVDCGGQAQEYDHFLGYERSFWYAVQPVCRPCHAKRPRSPRVPRSRLREIGIVVPERTPAAPRGVVCPCGATKGVRSTQFHPIPQCKPCRNQSPVLDLTCDKCGWEFQKVGVDAQLWLRNRKVRERGVWCANCWGNQTTFRERRLGTLPPPVPRTPGAGRPKLKRCPVCGDMERACLCGASWPEDAKPASPTAPVAAATETEPVAAGASGVEA